MKCFPNGPSTNSLVFIAVANTHIHHVPGQQRLVVLKPFLWKSSQKEYASFLISYFNSNSEM